MMYQNLIVTVIIILAAAFVLWKLYRFFISSEEEISCDPERCTSCSYKDGKDCGI
ncbi:FeoB-associated Cys-rich membrane protein [Spirochaetota bacterium]